MRIILFILGMWVSYGDAQPELEPWGNLTGIRVSGQLMEFGTSLRMVRADGSAVSTAKERQTPHYSRKGQTQIVETWLDSLSFTESVEDAGEGRARILVSCTAHADFEGQGVYFGVELPEALSGKTAMFADEGGLRISAAHRWLALRLERPGEIGLSGASNGRHAYDLPIVEGGLQKGQSVQLHLIIATGGEIDRAPVTLTLDTRHPGRAFDGLGGNFRIQNTKLDPQVIAYSLDNLRVAWGRVEFPWRFWQPEMDDHPLDSAKVGNLHPAVQRAMEMARTLGAKKIPFIVSAWFPPQWAVEGPLHYRPGPDHVWGNALNHANDPAIYKSIADYLVFLKERFGVEARYFSFNESDLGINVRQTAQEHDELIKGLGAYFASRGLKTRVLLGDNSDATTWSFTAPTIEDPAARPFVSMISFHSWRGFDTATLQKWADAADRLQVPVLVGEGSIDAAAWNYPAIFQEPMYALREISLYTRLLAVCQPLSILQWQLTADYSLLAGGGIFGDTSALHPTQRFWNLKQLSMTPAGLFAMPIASDRPNIAVAALGDNRKHLYTIHVVNNGAARQVILKGLPPQVKRLRSYETSATLSCKEGPEVRVTGGQAEFTLPAETYKTLIGE